jgi:hypothetical protein
MVSKTIARRSAMSNSFSLQVVPVGGSRMMGVTLKQYKKMRDDLIDAVEYNVNRKIKNGQKI